MTRWRRIKGFVFTAGMMFLAACEIPAPLIPPPPPTPVDRPQATPQSGASKKMQAFYGAMQADLLTRGLLRRDTGANIPFSPENLIENFITIAMVSENTFDGGRIVAQNTPGPLHRWQSPLRVHLEFGPSVPFAQRDQDRKTIRKYYAKLARLTGLSIRFTDTNPNVFVLILNQDERLNARPLLTRLIPSLSGSTAQIITRMDRSNPCITFSVSENAGRADYSRTIAVIRGELPDKLRQSCFHEELAQGLGLINDSDAARPSIFNDDEEFSLLTKHDELLLKILYDKRLRAGMDQKTARPIVKQIVAGLLGGPV